MTEVKTTIASTEPDVLGQQFSYKALIGMREQVNKADPKMLVKDNYGNVIGNVISAGVAQKQLTVLLEVEPALIDIRWEYYFIPFARPIVTDRENPKLAESVVLDEVRMVKFPADMNLTPVRFYGPDQSQNRQAG